MCNKRKQIIKRQFIFSIFILFAFLPTKLDAIFDLKFITSTQKVETIFTTSVEAKKQQLEEVEKYQDINKKKSDDASKVILNSLNIIKSDIVEAEESLKKAAEKKTEFLNRKINFLNDRKQVLLKSQELWKENVLLVEKQIKIIKEIIDVLQPISVKEEQKGIFSWKDFKLAQEKITEITDKINAEKSKKENLIRQRVAEKDNVIYSLKQVETRTKDREKLLKSKAPRKERDVLSEQDACLKEEINLLNDRLSFSNLKIENLEQEIKLKENDIEFLQNQFNDAKKNLVFVESRILLSPTEVDNAKLEWENEIQKNTKSKEHANQQREAKRAEKEIFTSELDLINEKVKKSKEEGDEALIFLLDSKISKLESLISIIDRELRLLDSKNELNEVIVGTKKLQYKTVELYYRLSIELEKLDEWVLSFKNQKDLVLNAIKALEESRKEGETISAEASRKIEHLKSKEEELKNKKNIIFKNQPGIYGETLINLNDAQKQYEILIQKTHEYLAANTDLMGKYDKIINQLNFVINDLEIKQVFNIWKRSPEAISWDDFQKSIIDAENFFVRLFWDTPSYFGPSNIFNLVKQLPWYGYLGLLLCIVFFGVLFIGTKKVLFILQNKVKNRINLFGEKTKFLISYLILESVLNFALDNFKLLFSWLFIFIHIVFDFKFIFSLIKPLAVPYSIALFYLASIPILLYLSSQFIIKIESLNQKLSFFFFTEKTQSKFIFLIKSVLYASSILLPLKQAFLWYSDIQSEFSNVILAAYTLIVIVVILLFFGKEDVLTLIPSTNNFFLWLKSKVDRYYYPVFIFLMGLLIISNRYIGYSNLAWYLAFAAPSTVFLIYMMILLHYYIRKHSISFFLQEEDEEIIDKFEHSKTYYGFFIITSFLALLFFNLILIGRIWRFTFTPGSLWETLSQDWVLTDAKIGIIQLLTVVSFVAIGFLVSSLVHKFVLNKLFDIFRTEPGTQNTFFRLCHYIIISFSLILGFVTIHLEQFIFWVGSLLALGIGFGLKDLVTDFIAGFFVLIERPIEIGNYIEVDEGVRGTVHKISARSTTIRTARNFSVIIPNKDLISKKIINWGQGRLAVGFEISLIVNYDANPQLVKSLLIETMKKHPAVLRVPSVVVRLEDFQENGLQFFARAFISSRRVRDQWEVASDLRFELVKVFAENNIFIPFPQRVIHIASDQKNDGKDKNISGIEIKFDQP